MDGRDIGTVVLPDAEVKVFLTARLGGAGPPSPRRDGRCEGEHDYSYEEVLEALRRRDELFEGAGRCRRSERRGRREVDSTGKIGRRRSSPRSFDSVKREGGGERALSVRATSSFASSFASSTVLGDGRREVPNHGGVLLVANHASPSSTLRCSASPWHGRFTSWRRRNSTRFPY